MPGPAGHYSHMDELTLTTVAAELRTWARVAEEHLPAASHPMVACWARARLNRVAGDLEAAAACDPDMRHVIVAPAADDLSDLGLDEMVYGTDLAGLCFAAAERITRPDTPF